MDKALETKLNRWLDMYVTEWKNIIPGPNPDRLNKIITGVSAISVEENTPKALTKGLKARENMQEVVVDLAHKKILRGAGMILEKELINQLKSVEKALSKKPDDWRIDREKTILLATCEKLANEGVITTNYKSKI
jgi:hypothetical protein